MASLSKPQPDSLIHSYYPSCIVNLRIRFDETLTVTSNTFPRLTSDMTVNAALVGPPYVGAPRLVEYGGSTEATQLFNRIPKSAHVELPAYRLAGKWSLMFDYNDLPIDPRTVRSLGVSIYMDTVPASDFADAMGATTSRAAGVQGAIPARTRRLSMLTPTLENCVMQGIADNWQVSHSASGSWVTIDGRDLRGCLLDSPISTALLAKMPLTEKTTIVDLVTWLVKSHPYGALMEIDPAPPADWPKGVIPSPYSDDGITSVGTRVVRGANGKKRTGGMIDAKPEVLNYWDVIVKYCTLVGAVPYFQAEKLRIKPARNLYDQQSLGTVRSLMFGRNIEELSIERKLAGRTPSQIEVTSLNTNSKQRGQQKLLVARWPEDNAPVAATTGATPAQRGAQTKRMNAIAKDLPASLVSGISPTNSAGKQDVITLSYPGITSIERLRTIAQELYEEIGRGELGGNVKTRNLYSFGAYGNENPDLVLLRPGDGIELLVDSRNIRSIGTAAGAPLSNDAGLPDSALIQRLTEKLGDANLARVIVASARNAMIGLNNTFRVSNVVFDFAADSGISVAFDFHNFIIVRDAVTPTPTKQNPSSAADRRVASAVTLKK